MKPLSESDFIRHKMFSKDKPKWKQYAAMVVGDRSIWAVLDYDVRIFLFGSLPGALGLVLRKVFFRKFFKKIGKGVIFGRNVTIRHGDKVELGDNIIIDDSCVIDGRGADGEVGIVLGSNTIVGRNTTIQAKVGSVSIGENCNIGADSVVISQGGIVIGSWTQVAGGCKIAGGRFKIDPERKDGGPVSRFTLGTISIGEGCFLGGGAQVTDAVSIGSFCAIGAGAVVMNNIPDYSVYMPRPGMIMGTTRQEEEK